MAFTRKRGSTGKPGSGQSRSGSETRKRGPKINCRVTDEERAKIEAAAQRAGLTVGSYVRSRALRQPTTRAVRRPPVEAAQLAKLLGMLGTAVGSIQQLAKNQNPESDAASVELLVALRDFREAAAAIIRTLGKRPHLSRDAIP